MTLWDITENLSPEKTLAILSMHPDLMDGYFYPGSHSALALANPGWLSKVLTNEDLSIVNALKCLQIPSFPDSLYFNRKTLDTSSVNIRTRCVDDFLNGASKIGIRREWISWKTAV